MHATRTVALVHTRDFNGIDLPQLPDAQYARNGTHINGRSLPLQHMALGKPAPPPPMPPSSTPNFKGRTFGGTLHTKEVARRVFPDDLEHGHTNWVAEPYAQLYNKRRLAHVSDPRGTACQGHTGVPCGMNGGV